MNVNFLPLNFSLILTVTSRLLHVYSTNDKISNLMMKSFSTVRDTWIGTQSYMEKRREEGDRGGQEEKRVNQTGKEQARQ